jgi:two-component system sensor histidine kinase HupT/HoxJ
MSSSREFPKTTVPPHTADEEEASGVFVFPGGQLVAVVIADESARARVLDIVRQGPYLAGGPDIVSSAVVVIADSGLPAPPPRSVDARTTLESRVRDLRRVARAGAAIILALDSRWSPEACAAAEAAGAFACLRTPLASESLEAVVKSATATHDAQTRIADLTRQLDLHSHLASLGRFTGGLHHELKNPLAVVEMNVNLVRDELSTLLEGRELLRSVAFAPVADRAKREQAAREFLARTEAYTGDLEAAIEDARLALERMRRLFGRLQNFVRREERAPDPVDVGALVRELRDGAAPLLEGVDVELVLHDELTALVVRPYVDEIFMNLAANAATAARTLSSPRVRFHAYASGDRVVVSVRDNGPGIAPEIQSQIFDPFFTTRRADGASGLGLALCREYATHMGAELSLWTAPGRGACFRLHLRRA